MNMSLFVHVHVHVFIVSLCIVNNMTKAQTENFRFLFIQAKPMCIINLLDDASKFVKTTDEAFALKLYDTHLDKVSFILFSHHKNCQVQTYTHS